MSAATRTVRLNLGCGEYLLPGWVNIDADPNAPADLHLSVPPLPWPGGSVGEIFAGHVLEHLEPETADELLAECSRVLRPGGAIGVVVPDTRELVRRYLRGGDEHFELPAGAYHRITDLDELCRFFLFSTYQPSRHRWAYDAETLARALARAGFAEVGPLDPNDPRIAVPVWWNLALGGVRP